MKLKSDKAKQVSHKDTGKAVIGTAEEQRSLPIKNWFLKTWRLLACIGGIVLGVVTFMVHSEAATQNIHAIIETY
jgi:hypothetical protein